MEKEKKINFIFLNSKRTNLDKKVIVALHGWQGNKNSFLPLTKNKLFDNCDWYLLEAPYPVGGQNDRRSWSYQKDENEWEIEEPKILLTNFFKSEIFKKYKSKRVYVIGFSQGALVCYNFICKLEKPLGAIFPISGFLRFEKNIIHKNQINTPIIIGHGLQDQVVSVEESKKAYNLLKENNANVKLLTYEGGHRMSNSIIKVISKRINKSE